MGTVSDIMKSFVFSNSIFTRTHIFTERNVLPKSRNITIEYCFYKNFDENDISEDILFEQSNTSLQNLQIIFNLQHSVSR